MLPAIIILFVVNMAETFKKILYTTYKNFLNILSSVCVWKNIICWNYIYLLALFVHLFITIIFLSLINLVDKTNNSDKRVSHSVVSDSMWLYGL